MPSSLPHLATLMAGPSAGAIALGLVAAVSRRLGADPHARWLDAGCVVDLHFDAVPADLPALAAEMRDLIAGTQVDCVLQPRAGRRKALLVADMDSTMIGQECIDELADLAGLKTRVAAITERAMRGDVAFEPALRERVALLKGLPVGSIERVLAERITPNPGAATLVRTMRAHGAHCALVSGGFTAFTGPVATKLGFDENHANVLETTDGTLSGTVSVPILGRGAKLARLLELRARLSLPRDATLAVGDGANDLDMLREAGLGVAFHATPAVASAAAARIDHGDLHALLFIQGYARSDFVG